VYFDISLQRSLEPPTITEIGILFTTFTCFGPIGRTCLQTIAISDQGESNRTLETYLAAIDMEIITFIARGGFQTVDTNVPQHASHRIAIMHPSPTGHGCVARISTRRIAHKVFERAQKKSQLHCFELYQHLTKQDKLRTSAGWLFEGYVHD